MDLVRIFEMISKNMINDFERVKISLNHSVSKGDENEEIVKKFLRIYLTKNLDISKGFLVDSDKNISSQLDIIISDTAKTPIFFGDNDIRIIPVECAYSVIEVKAYLNKTELEKSYNNMKSAKYLKKKAFIKKSGVIIHDYMIYGTKYSYWPLNYYIFAFDSDAPDVVNKNLIELQSNDEVDKRIDSICILRKGVIINKDQLGNFSALPSQGSISIASLTTKPLLFFYVLISHLLNQACMFEDFNVIEYTKEISF